MSGGNHPHGDCRDCATQRVEIKRMCEERDSAQRCIEKLTRELSEPVARLQRALSDDDGFKVACEALVAEKRLREKAEARVAALEAVVLAARRAKRAWITMETAHDFAEPALAADALDAALAALEVPRG